jgi:hypothetical protein
VQELVKILESENNNKKRNTLSRDSYTDKKTKNEKPLRSVKNKLVDDVNDDFDSDDNLLESENVGRRGRDDSTTSQFYGQSKRRIVNGMLQTFQSNNIRVDDDDEE